MTEHLRTYGLKYKARCMCAQRGYAEKTRFFVGTLTLREENQVHLIQVEEEEIICQSLFAHSQEVWCMTSSPENPLHLFTSSQSLVDSSSYTLPSYSSPSPPLSSLSQTLSPFNVCLWKLEEDEVNPHLHPLLSLHKPSHSLQRPLPAPTKQFAFF